MAPFDSATLERDGAVLVIATADGRRFEAPRLGGGDSSFLDPKLSPDRKYVAWAVGQRIGGSYASPIYLAVLDAANRLHTFSGDYGVVWEWCFPPARPGTVAFSYAFPHGASDKDFELRRIDDERLIARYRLTNAQRNAGQAPAEAPAWVRCDAQDWYR